MNKFIRILRNGYLICNILFIVSWFVLEWRLRLSPEDNLLYDILAILSVLGPFVFLYYMFDLVGANTAVLIVIAILCIKDFQNTREKWPLAVTCILMAGSFLLNMNILITVPFEYFLHE